MLFPDTVNELLIRIKTRHFFNLLFNYSPDSIFYGLFHNSFNILEFHDVLERLSFCSGEKQALEIEEMDLNPFLLYEKGLDVVDARIILKE
jgi:hypothetical protein